jgi:catechol 2,3-dioxygenase-like lactoylglutathione lyase family enzyme
MAGYVSLITVGVRDVERARRFYVDDLGFQAAAVGDEHTIFLRAGSVVISLWQRDQLEAEVGLSAGESGFGGITLAQNLPSKTAVDEMLARAEAAGGRIVKPAEDMVWGGYSGYFADPDGHLWEVAWNPHFGLADDGRLTLPS